MRTSRGGQSATITVRRNFRADTPHRFFSPRKQGSFFFACGSSFGGADFIAQPRSELVIFLRDGGFQPFPQRGERKLFRGVFFPFHGNARRRRVAAITVAALNAGQQRRDFLRENIVAPRTPEAVRVGKNLFGHPAVRTNFFRGTQKSFGGGDFSCGFGFSGGVDGFSFFGGGFSGCFSSGALFAHPWESAHM